jgi:hypothetical protein
LPFCAPFHCYQHYAIRRGKRGCPHIQTTKTRVFINRELLPINCSPLSEGQDFSQVTLHLIPSLVILSLVLYSPARKMLYFGIKKSFSS